MKTQSSPAWRRGWGIKLFLILIVVGGVFIANKFSWQGDDLSILSIVGDRVEMVNISPERGMVNSYLVEDTDLWIPNGMGWYPSSRLGLIVKNDVNLARKVMFYNFGFWPKYVIWQGTWNDNKSLWSILGPVGWLRFRLLSDQWLWKNETLKINNLAEIMPRDMSNSQVIRADIKINVVNASGKNGLGNMIADRLEWWGLMVTSVQTSQEEKESVIYVDFNKARQNKSFETISLLAKIMGCKVINRDGGVELILGTDIEEMIKYSQTYVRAF